MEYQRDLAVALMSQSRVLLPLDRIEESVSRAKESVAMLDRLTTSDRRNASFRLDLSDAEIALAESFSRQGQFSHALENISLPIAIQEEQARRFPDYPDFRRQAAHYHRTAAAYKNASSDFKGALEEYRGAEVIDRALTARYPNRFEFAEALRADMDSPSAAQLFLSASGAGRQAAHRSDCVPYRKARCAGIAKAARARPARRRVSKRTGKRAPRHGWRLEGVLAMGGCHQRAA